MWQHWKGYFMQKLTFNDRHRDKAQGNVALGKSARAFLQSSRKKQAQ